MIAYWDKCTYSRRSTDRRFSAAMRVTSIANRATVLFIVVDSSSCMATIRIVSYRYLSLPEEKHTIQLLKDAARIHSESKARKREGNRSGICARHDESRKCHNDPLIETRYKSVCRLYIASDWLTFFRVVPRWKRERRTRHWHSAWSAFLSIADCSRDKAPAMWIYHTKRRAMGEVWEPDAKPTSEFADSPR